jgi:hypothetical protein
MSVATGEVATATSNLGTADDAAAQAAIETARRFAACCEGPL